MSECLPAEDKVSGGGRHCAGCERGMGGLVGQAQVLMA